MEESEESLRSDTRRRNHQIWEMREMNYSNAELRDAAAAKIQRMVLLALGKNYLRREKVCFCSPVLFWRGSRNLPVRFMETS